jgi:DNA-binding PadR family transcriptional regulator
LNIQHAILGLLSFKPMTGYDIKKVMQSSLLFHWSGNNSQIYRTLAEMQAEGLITAEILYGAALPAKKKYSLTEQGRHELSDLSRAFPELPEIRKPFLMQLVFGQDWSRQELETLLEQYEGEIRGVLLTVDDIGFPETDHPLQSTIRDLTIANIRQVYENELAWVDRVCREVLPLAADREKSGRNEGNVLEYKVVNKGGQTYIAVTGGQIKTERDALALVSVCAEQGTNLLMLSAACLSDEFWHLSTGVAGSVLQKLVNYNIKTVAVSDAPKTARWFREFLSESNKGQTFRAYDSVEDAERWLLEGAK